MYIAVDKSPTSYTYSYSGPLEGQMSPAYIIIFAFCKVSSAVRLWMLD